MSYSDRDFELEQLLRQRAAWVQAEEEPEEAGQDGAGEDESRGDQPRKSQADHLIKLAQSLTLFHDDLQDSYAVVPVDKHKEIWRCRSKPFRRYLAYWFFQQHQKAPSSEALNSALGMIEGKAVFEGEQHALFNRVAWYDGAIWYDLTDPLWRAVKITVQGWEIVKHPPILFRRYAHQASQAEPVRDGTLDLLDKYVNMTGPALDLFKVTLCAYLVPEIPHPIMHPHGEKGAGKSFLFRVLREVVDPSQVLLLSFPRDRAELAQQLSHHYCALYDNVSFIPPWASDALCRAATGEGFTKRELYSDDEYVIYTFRRCVGLNGINIVATATDLLDRSILIEMDQIDEDHRQEEKKLWAEFEQDKPRILGAVFDVLAKAIAIKPKVKIERLPRMADFAVWGEAIYQGLGRKAGDFIKLYQDNIMGQHQEVARGHVVAAAIVEFMGDKETWTGTATDLLGELVAVGERIRLNMKGKGWPKAPHALTRRLKEVVSNLRAVGVAVSFDKDDKKRSIRLERVGEKASKASKASDTSDSARLGVDATPDASLSNGEYRQDSVSKNPQTDQGLDATDATDATDAISLTLFSDDPEATTDEEVI